MNIATILHDRAREAGDRAALIHRGRVLSFAGLDAAAARAAAACESAGLRAGDRALVFCPMSIDLYVTLAALFRLGVAAIFVDPSSGRADLAACCQRTRPRGFVAIPRAHALRLLSRDVRAIPVALAIGGRTPGATTLAATGGAIARDAITPRAQDDEALLTFTSGSTGRRKAAVRTHGFLLAQHAALASSLDLAPGQIDLATLPVFVLANLASGVTSVIADADLRAPGAVEPAPLLRQIRAHRPTRVAASPAFLDRIAAHAEALHVALDSFDRIDTGGAPVFPRLLRRLRAVAPRARVSAIYGSTEAEPIAHLDSSAIGGADLEAMREGAGLLAGTPVGAIDLRILPDRWGEPLGPVDAATFDGWTLPRGAAGEIVVAGAHVLSGYLDGAGDRETKIHAGGRVWHRTGDAGRLDAGGRLWLLGRASARIDDGRGRIYPFTVECAASELDGVARSAFLRHRGRRVLALEAEPRAPADLAERLLAALAWAQVDEVRRVDAIPVDARHNAKVDYTALAGVLDE